MNDATTSEIDRCHEATEFDHACRVCQPTTGHDRGAGLDPDTVCVDRGDVELALRAIHEGRTTNTAEEAIERLWDALSTGEVRQ